MRAIYFFLMGGMLLLLVILVDWPERFDDLGQKPGLQALQRFLAAEPSDTAATPYETSRSWSDSLGLDSLLSNSGLDLDLPPLEQIDFYEALLTPPESLAIVPASGRRNLASSPPLRTLRTRAAPAPDKRGSHEAVLPPEHNFQDVAEEPYLQESRKLLGLIHRNYDRIIQRRDSSQAATARSR